MPGFFRIMFIVFLLSCKGESRNIKDNESISQQASIEFQRDQYFELDSTNHDSGWRVIRTWTKDVSEYYAYEIRWIKDDSLLIFHADSKCQDTFIPVSLGQIYLKSKCQLVGISFEVGYTHNLPVFAPPLKNIDIGKISSISFEVWSENTKSTYSLYSNIAEEKKVFDSVIKVLALK